MAQKQKVILDLAAGTETAIAQIVSTSIQAVKLIGVTTSWGALPLAVATTQALQIFGLLGKQVPVYVGCPDAIAKNDYRKPDLLSDHNYPEAMIDLLISVGTMERKAAKKHAVRFIIDTCRESQQKVTLIGLGPLTNYGMALSIAPDIVQNINEIVVVGGGITLSDITASAEKNIWLDPEAAQMVINSGAKVVIIPIDITHRINLNSEIQKTFMELDNPVGEILRSVQKQFDAGNNTSGPMVNGTASPLATVVSLAYLIETLPLLTLRQVHLQICLDHNEGAGAFLIDQRQDHGKPNVYLADEVDSGVFNAFLLASLTSVNAGH